MKKAGTPQDIVARLAGRGMRDLYIDGGVTIQRFLEAWVDQRVIITRIPVLLGSGIPLFGAGCRETFDSNMWRRVRIRVGSFRASI